MYHSASVEIMLKCTDKRNISLYNIFLCCYVYCAALLGNVSKAKIQLLVVGWLWLIDKD